jgi:hypothetical protein
MPLSEYSPQRGRRSRLRSCNEFGQSIKNGALLSDIWDGKPAKRIRAADGISILPGRRLAMHIMIQPDAANSFLSNRTLRDQGLLSRILVASPKSLAGTRLYKEATEDDNEEIRTHGKRI